MTRRGAPLAGMPGSLTSVAELFRPSAIRERPCSTRSELHHCSTADRHSTVDVGKLDVSGKGAVKLREKFHGGFL